MNPAKQPTKTEQQIAAIEAKMHDTFNALSDRLDVLEQRIENVNGEVTLARRHAASELDQHERTQH